MTGEGHWFPKLQHRKGGSPQQRHKLTLIDKCVGYFKSPDRTSRLNQRRNVPVHELTRAIFHGNQLSVTN